MRAAPYRSKLAAASHAAKYLQQDPSSSLHLPAAAESAAALLSLEFCPTFPCSNNVPWTFSKCHFEDFNGWADAADQKLRAAGVKLDAYFHRWGPGSCPRLLLSCQRRSLSRAAVAAGTSPSPHSHPHPQSPTRTPTPACSIYLLPPAFTCRFVGLAYIGCDGSFECRSWISGGLWTNPQVGCTVRWCGRLGGPKTLRSLKGPGSPESTLWSPSGPHMPAGCQRGGPGLTDGRKEILCLARALSLHLAVLPATVCRR